MNSRRSQLGYMSIYNRIKELTICLLLKKLQLSFLRKGYIMHWIIGMWYYRQEEDNLNRSARIVLYILLSIIFKGGEWVVCKNSNPWCSTKRTRGEYKAKRWGGTGSLTGSV